jgi:hypothetical protein
MHACISDERRQERPAWLGDKDGLVEGRKEGEICMGWQWHGL